MNVYIDRHYFNTILCGASGSCPFVAFIACLFQLTKVSVSITLQRDIKEKITLYSCPRNRDLVDFKSNNIFSVWEMSFSDFVGNLTHVSNV